MPVVVEDKLKSYTSSYNYTIGLAERAVGSEAQRQGIEARVAKLPTSSVLRTRTIDEGAGLIRLIDRIEP